MSDEREIEDLARELRGVWLDIDASADRIGPSWRRLAGYIRPRLVRPAPPSLTRVEIIDASGRVFVAYLAPGFSEPIDMRGAVPGPVAAGEKE